MYLAGKPVLDGTSPRPVLVLLNTGAEDVSVRLPGKPWASAYDVLLRHRRRTADIARRAARRLPHHRRRALRPRPHRHPLTPRSRRLRRSRATRPACRNQKVANGDLLGSRVSGGRRCPCPRSRPGARPGRGPRRRRRGDGRVRRARCSRTGRAGSGSRSRRSGAGRPRRPPRGRSPTTDVPVIWSLLVHATVHDLHVDVLGRQRAERDEDADLERAAHLGGVGDAARLDVVDAHRRPGGADPRLPRRQLAGAGVAVVERRVPSGTPARRARAT